MARKAAGGNHYINTGTETKKSGRRERSEAGRLAAFIIDRIPEGYDVWKDIDINEAHLVREIVGTCGRWIRYCPQRGWMVYKAEEGRWTENGAESVVQRVIIHFGELLFEGSTDTNPGERTFARRILSSAGVSAVKNLLRRDVSIAADEKAFDADPRLLNCRGDMYNLRTGETRACEPEDLFSKSAYCKAAPLKKTDGEWDLPEKFPKIFEDFILKITGKDGVTRPDLGIYLLSWFGYCLTGDTGASFLVNFHGVGKNGKSVLLKLMLELFGDYGMTLHPDVVIDRFAQGQFDKADLAGKRLAVLTDAPEGRLNMDELKSIVSGDPIKARRKYLADIEFSPICKVAVASNFKLKLKDTSLGVRRRIRMVPFDYTVTDDEDDPNIARKMIKEEAAEILSLLIFFANRYYKNGEGPKAFPKCDIVDQTSAEYMKSQDLVGRWKTERTETAEANMKNSETSADLYDDFRKWCADEGVKKIMSKSTFGEHLIVLVPDKKRTSSDTLYLGIKLKPKPRPDLDKGG